MTKSAAQLDRDIAAFVAKPKDDLPALVRDAEAAKREVLASATKLKQALAKIGGGIQRKRTAYERELEMLDELDEDKRTAQQGRYQALERMIDQLDEASIPDGDDIYRGIRELLRDEAVIRIP